MFRVATFQAREKGSRGTPPKRDVAELAERLPVGRAAPGFLYIYIKVPSIYCIKVIMFELLCITFCFKKSVMESPHSSGLFSFGKSPKDGDNATLLACGRLGPWGDRGSGTVGGMG